MELEVTDTNFETEVLGCDLPVVVDFWADWCMPCKMIEPVLEELSGEFEGKAVIGRLNVDEQPDIASRYNIVSIPSLLVFKNGEVADQHIGAAPRETLAEFITRNLD